MSEKDAHLAWLEATSEGNIHTRSTIDRLRKERRDLLLRMKEDVRYVFKFAFLCESCFLDLICLSQIFFRPNSTKQTLQNLLRYFLTYTNIGRPSVLALFFPIVITIILQNENRGKLMSELEESTCAMFTGTIKISTLGSFGEYCVSTLGNIE